MRRNPLSLTAAVLAALLWTGMAGQAHAGKLDLDIYVAGSTVIYEPDIPLVPKDLWLPGSPLGLRGQSRGMRAFSHAGYAALGALGMAETLKGLGRDGYTEASAAGFAVVAVVNLWRLWKVGREP